VIERPFEADIEAAIKPDLVSLDDDTTAAVFGLMKLVPAEYILRRAAAEGLIEAGSVVIESTSGGFGHGLAVVARERDYRFIMVSDPVVDAKLQARLEYFGASVDIVSEPATVGGIQGARLARVEQLVAENPGAYWPRQYDNPWNALAYAEVANYIVDTHGPFDCIVGTVGTGGSMCGLVPALRDRLPDIQAVGVDTYGSVLFGHPDRKRLLRGLGNSVMPAVLDHALFDEIHWVTAAEGFLATRHLRAQTDMYRGPTSGAARMVARWWRENNPGKRIVVVFPDEGDRYADTVYSDEWLRANDVHLDRLPDAPHPVADPRAAQHRWTRCEWGRRSLDEVLDGD
jgi:cysteine synthase A